MVRSFFSVTSHTSATEYASYNRPRSKSDNFCGGLFDDSRVRRDNEELIKHSQPANVMPEGVSNRYVGFDY